MYLVFTCKNRSRYSRERASQNFEEIQLVVSIHSLAEPLPRLGAAIAGRPVRPLSPDSIHRGAGAISVAGLGTACLHHLDRALAGARSGCCRQGDERDAPHMRAQPTFSSALEP